MQQAGALSASCSPVLLSAEAGSPSSMGTTEPGSSTQFGNQHPKNVYWCLKIRASGPILVFNGPKERWLEVPNLSSIDLFELSRWPRFQKGFICSSENWQETLFLTNLNEAALLDVFRCHRKSAPKWQGSKLGCKCCQYQCWMPFYRSVNIS